MGEETAEDLAEQFGTLEKIRVARLEDLNKVSGIGEVVSQSVFDWFRQSENIKLVDQLLKQVKVLSFKKKIVRSKITGQSFVLTGTLPTMSREEASAQIKKFGGRVVGSVSAKTNYVLAGDNPGSKIDTANDLGVKIIDEEEFKKLVGI